MRYWLKKFNLETCPAKARVIMKEKDRKCLTCKESFKIGNWSPKKFCSLKCASDHLYLQYVLRWKKGLETGVTGSEGISNHIRRYLFEKYKNKCVKCGWCEVHPITKRRPLTINHIDGNPLNNIESNLELICPSCHSLTPNYGVLNKGRGRQSRREKRKTLQ